MIKYKIYVFLLFLVSICTVNATTNSDMLLLGKVIYIDPGHGGIDPGAMYKDIKEKDINLSISLKLEQLLLSNGAIVYMTRYGDYDLSVPNTINRKRSDLSRRSNIINNSDCDIFLSIHLNSEISQTWKGPQIFYDDINTNNKIMAEIFQKKLNKKLKGNRKYKQVTDMYLQKRVTRPGILVEVGFLSNSNDRYLLKHDDYQYQVVNTLLEGIIEYFSVK